MRLPETAGEKKTIRWSARVRTKKQRCSSGNEPILPGNHSAHPQCLTEAQAL